MNVKTALFNSQHLNKDVSVGIYGHFGFTILLFPAQTDSHKEAEENGMIEALSSVIRIGKCKVFTVPSVNEESWFSQYKSNYDRSRRHFEYNKFIEDEVVPLIYEDCGGPVPILTCGASIGAFHAANTFFRRPDMFWGTIAISGDYNLESMTGGYFDENCYFNSPTHYLPNLNDKYWMSFLLSRHHIYIATGSGENENPDNSRRLSNILNQKGISHTLDLWGTEWNHDWKTWTEMMKYFLLKKL